MIGLFGIKNLQWYDARGVSFKDNGGSCVRVDMLFSKKIKSISCPIFPEGCSPLISNNECSIFLFKLSGDSFFSGIKIVINFDDDTETSFNCKFHYFYRDGAAALESFEITPLEKWLFLSLVYICSF